MNLGRLGGAPRPPAARRPGAGRRRARPRHLGRRSPPGPPARPPACATTSASSPGDRVAIVMRNRPEYLEALFAIWHAGLVAVPVNARLHRDEIAYILERQRDGRRRDRRRARRRRRVAGRHVASLQAAVVAPGERWDRLTASSPAPLVDRQPDDPAWLFYTSGTTGRPKGATLTQPQPAHDVAQLLRRHRPGDAAGLHPPRRAAVARRGALRAAARRPRGGQRRAAVRRRRRRRDRRAPAALAGDVVLRRAHHGEAAGRRPGHRRRRPVAPEDDHLRRRADVPGRPGGRPRPSSVPAWPRSTGRARRR